MALNDTDTDIMPIRFDLREEPTVHLPMPVLRPWYKRDCSAAVLLACSALLGLLSGAVVALAVLLWALW